MPYDGLSGEESVLKNAQFTMHNAQLKMEALLPSLKFKLEFVALLWRANCRA